MKYDCQCNQPTATAAMKSAQSLSEKLLLDFATANKDTEMILSELTRKLSPLIDQRPSPETCSENKDCIPPEYNSDLFRALNEALTVHRTLNRNFRTLLSAIEL